MRILFISNVVPNPAGGGSPRRAAMHLQCLQTMGHVTLVHPPLDGLPSLETEGTTVLEQDFALAEVRLWRHEAARSPAKRIYHAARRLNLVEGRADRAEAKRFREALNTHFDLIFAFRLRSALWYESVFGRKKGSGVRIVDFDDIESRVFAKQIERPSGPLLWRAKLRRELGWLRRTERRVANEWDAACLCSRLDADRFQLMTEVNPWIVPNAYQFGANTNEPLSSICRLLFVGTFGYFANVDGVSWFVDTIWSKVRADLGGDIELSLVGLDPTPAILALGDREGITVAGNVPSVDPYYAQCNIVIAPLHAGSGTRIKLIEAAAKGRAIVTTTLGCEGLGLADGVHAEIADEPADFAARIVALARDPARRAELAAAARAHAEQEFSADKIITDLSKKIQLALASSGSV